MLEDGFAAAGIFEDEETSSASTLHFNGQQYINYIPQNQINRYNTDSQFSAIPIDYKVGNFLPLSIVDIGDGSI